ncbi:MAG: putative baseplate assembly protein [Desulfobaccales bacterium]
MTGKQKIMGPGPQAAALEKILQNLPGYVPEWLPAEGSSALALMKILSHYTETLAGALAQVPDRSLLAFLDMLGMHKSPAQSARAPLVFTLMDNAPVNVSLPAFSRVAATPPPAAPSLAPGGDGSATPQPILFVTEKTVALYRGKLAALYSIDPGRDEFADHTARLIQGFSLFEDMDLTGHIIYLGHDQLFNLAGYITVLLYFTLETPAPEPMQVQWEYLSQSGWLALNYLEQDDTTRGFTRDGQVALRRQCGPSAKQETIHGRTTYWLRGHLTTPLLPEGTGGKRTIPIMNDISARLNFNQSGLLPEAAFADAVSLDISKDFYPFGQQPVRYSTFYLASREVFQRQGANIGVTITLSSGITVVGTPDISWEYYNGMAWQAFAINCQFNKAVDVVSFRSPPDWCETEVNGVRNFWLRVRILGGDDPYGHPLRVVVDNPEKMTTKFEEKNLNPPIISKLTLGFSYVTDPEALNHCLSYNDFVFTDLTEACRWPDQTFKPFLPVSDTRPTVHFGFDLPLPVGLVSLYVDIAQEVSESGAAGSSPFIWEYFAADGWQELGVLDETLGFQRRGMIQFIGPQDAVAAPGLGGELFRLRARLKQGEEPSPAALQGVWLNAVWAAQRDFYDRELLGTSAGNPHQTLSCRHAPVLEGEVVEIPEWSGRGDSWQISMQEVAPENLRLVRDPATGMTTVRVRWHPQPHLYSSKPNDRHYVVDRATGLIRFGDGRQGLIPPAGCRVYASYSSGGGVRGNVPAAAISELRTALPYLMAAANPVPASGGADSEADLTVKIRGPELIRHAGRAVSARDVEWLAREASPDLARVRCLPLTGRDGFAQRGWITLLVVPFSQELRPQPAVELQRRVCDYVAKRVPATVAQHVRVIGPTYELLSVRAEIIPHDPYEAALVEARVRSSLNSFLHPLIGGLTGQGWDFGEPVYLSQIARVIETTPGVDYGREIILSLDEQICGESVPIAAGKLVSSGTHELKLVLGEG